MADDQLIIVTARSPGHFQEEVNKYLIGGSWRVVETEMSVTDGHYWAMLVREKVEVKLSTNTEAK